MSGLAIDTTWEEGLCLLTLVGEARLETVETLDTVAIQVEERGVKAVIMNLADLQFMDSASTGSMIRLHGDLERAGGHLVLHSVPRMIQRLLDRLGLQQFVIVSDEVAARERLA
jgi:anti-anti-sigma factor